VTRYKGAKHLQDISDNGCLLLQVGSNLCLTIGGYNDTLWIAGINGDSLKLT